jgi:prevent-host-death family protein
MAIKEAPMSTRTLSLIPGHPMESLSSTETQTAFGKVLGRVLRGTVIGITRHDEVTAVLMSADTYEALLAQRSDPLAQLRDRFDQRFAAMQTPEAKAGVRALFNATPLELGRAAVNGAKKRG